jgi:hypothetical protein
MCPWVSDCLFLRIDGRMDTGMTSSDSNLRSGLKIKEMLHVWSDQHQRQDTACLHQDMAHVHHDITHVGGCRRRLRFVVRGKRLTKEQARAHSAAGAIVQAVPELVGGGGGMSVRAFSMHCVCLCVYGYAYTYVHMYAHARFTISISLCTS